MKKGAISFILVLLISTSLVSALFACSDGNLNEDQDEIDLYGRTSVNGLGFGLINSDETAITSSYSASLIADAEKFTLTDTENSTEIELKKDIYTIVLTNVSNEVATIKIDGSSELLELKDTQSVKGLLVFLTSIEGEFPGATTVKGIIGDEPLDIDNKDPEKIVTVKNMDYGVELFSASDSNAIIRVFKCENESARLSIVEPVIIENNTIINETSNQTDNNLTLNQTINETPPSPGETTNQTNISVNTSQRPSDSAESDEKSDSKAIWYVVVIISILIIIIIGLIIYNRIRTGKELDKAESIPEST